VQRREVILEAAAESGSAARCIQPPTTPRVPHEAQVVATGRQGEL